VRCEISVCLLISRCGGSFPQGKLEAALFQGSINGARYFFPHFRDEANKVCPLHRARPDCIWQDLHSPRDLYHGKGTNLWRPLKTLKANGAIVCVGGGSMKRFGFLDRAEVPI
jgi:hypothetical protein